MDIDLKRLADFFAPEDVEWKPLTFTKDKTKALAAAYITNRAIMDRLDEVCGPGGWRNEYREGPQGGVLCGLSIYAKMPSDDYQWITKWDGAENTKVEPIKGGLSDSMKRAASQWGIGRYLYKLPSLWVPVDDRGRFKQEPSIPREFLPPGTKQAAPVRQLVPTQQAGEPTLSDLLRLNAEAGHSEFDLLKVARAVCGVNDLDDLSPSDVQTLVNRLMNKAS